MGCPGVTALGVTALCVDPARIDDVWPYVSRFIASAFWRDRGDDDAEIVLADLKAQRALLWIAWDGDAIIAAATTKLIEVARGRACLVTSCGGDALRRWKSCLAEIESYARDEGCRVVRFEGRKGWQAFFPDYVQPWIVLEKQLRS